MQPQGDPGHHTPFTRTPNAKPGASQKGSEVKQMLALTPAGNDSECCATGFPLTRAPKLALSQQAAASHSHYDADIEFRR